MIFEDIGMRKSKVCAGLLLSLLSGIAHSAVTPSTNALNMQWAGSVPMSPVTTGSWKFVSLTDPTKDFVPAVGIVRVNDDKVNVGGRLLETSPVEFALQTTGAGFFTDGSAVKAYLASDVAFAGLTNTAALPTMKIQSGSKVIPVGAAGAIDLGTIVGKDKINNFPVSLKGVGTLPKGSFNEGDNFTVHTAVMFTASVGENPPPPPPKP